ncbi:DUF4301 family protein [Lacihabitans sp. LS3-19]|uniref:DUF4301 family protein n=1 Tax=Lacihabitans sp. LS3-19 TaxID=2487335 RepID=UPI0020CBC268|nr:DUF4301 family protein [Lacihabitans sp. LS3-19]MCP9769520.1 DUF4301 family protein [Lacihabitans sp. LS3-19]
MQFSEKDLKQIAERGSDVKTIEQQIENFKSGFPFMTARRAATIGDGMIKLDDTKLKEYLEVFENQSTKKKLLKFVPASGAASRMFKSLYAAKDEGKSDKSVEQFHENLKSFAFYNSLSKYLGNGEKQASLEALLGANGLDYGNLPKGLLEFHSYGNTTRTAIEEHLVEGALYANNKGKVRLHFTVSPEHKKKFRALINTVKSQYEQTYNVKYDITFSEQKASTDTVAVDLNNEPFLDNQGKMLFRPAGHGALLENLNDIDADVIFIKNVDNVVPDHLKNETITYKKALAGLLLDYQKQIFYFLKRLQKPKPTTYMVNKAVKFIRETLNVETPKGFRLWIPEQKLQFALSKLDRPLRVCGMVKNVGEPGGGPFWAKNSDESISLQIVESAQFDMKNKKQKEIFENATHFNPVDLICATKNIKKEKYDLLKFRDPKTGFITEKSQSGKTLKAQELPGLWNGAMSDWNTLFVEVPLITFNPVKTVNDLLRKEHQPA